WRNKKNAATAPATTQRIVNTIFIPRVRFPSSISVFIAFVLLRSPAPWPSLLPPGVQFPPATADSSTLPKEYHKARRQSSSARQNGDQCCPRRHQSLRVSGRQATSYPRVRQIPLHRSSHSPRRAESRSPPDALRSAWLLWQMCDPAAGGCRFAGARRLEARSIPSLCPPTSPWAQSRVLRVSDLRPRR